MWKKSDDAHDMAGSKDDALIWLAENGHMTGDTSPNTSPEPEPEASRDTSDPATTDGGETVEFPENPDAGGDSDPEPSDTVDPNPECPADGCDGEIVDATAMMRQRPDLSAEHKQLLRESDFVCAGCGGVFDQ